MIEVLTWISIFSGGLLILLLLLSLIGGLDLDIDLGDTDVDTDTGNIGILKGFLTFLSVGSWVVKIVLVLEKNPAAAFGIGLLVGLLAVFLLNLLMRILLKNQSNVNWSQDEALFKEGKVYLKIPEGTGTGIIHVNINGVHRELKAKTNSGKSIPTGATVLVEDLLENIAVVSELN